jgi:hypothetical protein
MHFYGVGFRTSVKTIVAAYAALATVNHIMVAALIQFMPDTQYFLRTRNNATPAGLALQRVDNWIGLVAISSHIFTSFTAFFKESLM